MKRLWAAAAATLALCAGTSARAEYDPEIDKGVKLNFSEDGKRFLRIMTWHQVWMRYDEHNPGSVVRGGLRESGFDIGIRRSRILLQAVVTPELTIVTHFGINNQGVVNGGFGAADQPKKPQIFFHDVYGEYKIAGEWLAVGAGLHYWTGISRLASASTITFMTIDAPIYNWPNIDKTDQFARQFGVYAKGKIQKLDYRVSVNQPFATAGTPKENVADYDPSANSLAVQGYFKYDFLEPEPSALPYFAGTYLGKKKVLNLGTGFYWHKGAMAHLENGVKKNDDQVLFGVDTFLDLPLGKRGLALTAYASLLLYDFGPNFVRNIGALNPSTGLQDGAPSSFNGAGNALPTVGTGSTFHTQVGLLLPDMGKGGQLQPYGTFRYSSFQGLDSPVIVPEGGLNWFIVGHHAKLTLNYRSRPVFEARNPGKPVVADHKNEVTLQAQVFY
jgi:hypothetical protein